MTLFRDVLTRSQEAVLRSFAVAAREENLYLAGGTAVALRLGHRRSIDLDWFSERRIDDPERLIRRLQAKGIALQPNTVEPGTIYAEVDLVRVSIIQFPYPALHSLDVIEGVPMAHLDDLACMKLDALATRGARKDFLDVHALCTSHAPLLKLVARYRQRFPTANAMHLLVALTYFEDAERTPMPMMLWPTAWDAVKRDFVEWVDAFDLSA